MAGVIRKVIKSGDSQFTRIDGRIIIFLYRRFEHKHIGAYLGIFILFFITPKYTMAKHLSFSMTSANFPVRLRDGHFFPKDDKESFHNSLWHIQVYIILRLLCIENRRV